MTDRYRIEFSDQAWMSIGEAYEWIRVRSPDAAERWLRGIHGKINSLDMWPRSSRVVRPPSAEGPEVRQITYGKRRGTDRIFYEVHADHVYIVDVQHGARQSPYGPAD